MAYGIPKSIRFTKKVQKKIKAAVGVVGDDDSAVIRRAVECGLPILLETISPAALRAAAKRVRARHATTGAAK